MTPMNTDPRTEAGRLLLTQPANHGSSCPGRINVPDAPSCRCGLLDAILDIEAEAAEEALSVERIAEALQIGWPGSKARRQTYRALAAGLRVALLRKEAPRD